MRIFERRKVREVGEHGWSWGTRDYVMGVRIDWDIAAVGVLFAVIAAVLFVAVMV